MGRRRKYGVNEDFFKEWNPKMAYVLGMIISDGNIQPNYALRIVNKEKVILEKIKEFIKSKNPIYERIYKSKDRIESNGYVLQIGSKKIFNDLIKLGITQNKSKTIEMPNIPDKYLSYFLQGLIDGDGSVYTENHKVIAPINRILPLKYKKYFYKRLVISIYSASRKFLEKLRNNILKINFKIQNISELKKENYDSVYRISINSQQAIKLGNYIYNNILVESKKSLNYKTVIQ